MSKMATIYERTKPIRDALHHRAMLFEVLEDKKHGVLVERWVCVKRNVTGHPVTTSIILFATPTWWDMFSPMTEDGRIEAAIDAVKAITDD